MEEDRPFIDSLKGMRIGGRYIVDKVLGSGGMGVVAVAKYPELHQKVAIKFLRPEHASNAILNARFVREGRLAARVKSEHFVRVFDIGKLPTGVPYLVMELLAGHDLADELIEHGPLAVEPAIDWVLQALVGLAEIHALGVVHRDLKPSNLFISEAAGKRMVKVLDFGISKENAKQEGAPLTATDNLLGTPQYMSPEQVRASKDVDERSDIWAVGVILYELLTGKRPFVSDENATGELFAKVLYIDPLPPREHRPELAPELEAVILKCLNRDRDARFANVPALADALRPFAAASAEHHIEAVKQAAAMKRTSLVPPGEDDDDAQPLSQAETETTSSSPHAKRSSGPNGDASDQAPVTAMTSATGSRAREAKSSSKKPLIAVLGVGAVLGIAAFVITSTHTTPTPPAPAAPPPVSAPVTTTAAPEPTSAPTPSETAPPAVSVAPAPLPTHMTVTAPRPRPSATAAPKPSAGSLIEDRK